MPVPRWLYKLVMKLPPMVSVGVAVKPVTGLAISGEVKYIGWRQVMGSALSITGPKAYNQFDPHWRNQTVYALGVNYQVNPKLQVRGGFNYAKSPIDSHAVGYNMILPAVVESHFTLGTSYQLNNRWGVGAAYMVASRKTYTAPMTPSPTNPDKGQKIGLAEQAFSFNLSYKF